MKNESWIKLINYTISTMDDEFTIHELSDRIQERYPKYAPSTKNLKKCLRWPSINAVKIGDNGRYRRIN